MVTVTTSTTTSATTTSATWTIEAGLTWPELTELRKRLLMAAREFFTEADNLSNVCNERAREWYGTDSIACSAAGAEAAQLLAETYPDVTA